MLKTNVPKIKIDCLVEKVFILISCNLIKLSSSYAKLSHRYKADDSREGSHGTSRVRLSARVPPAMNPVPKKRIQPASSARSRSGYGAIMLAPSVGCCPSTRCTITIDSGLGRSTMS